MENGIIENDNEINQAVTVNGQLYNDMLNNFFIPAIEGMNLESLYFQQDG